MSTAELIPWGDPAFWQNPHPVLAGFRAKHRTALTDTGQLAVLRWDDAEWAIRGHDFINEGIERLEARGFRPGDPLHTWRSHALGIMEGPDHTRIRKLVTGAMSRRNMEPLRPLIRGIAGQLIDRLPRTGSVDIQRGFTAQLPRLVMMEFLDIGADELMGSMGPLADARIADCFGQNVTQAMRDKANGAIRMVMDHVASLYDKRRREPRDDLLTSLLEAHDDRGALSMPELITLFSTIFGSGSTTAGTLDAGLLELALHPEQQALFRSDPGKWKRGVCEETLRMHPGIAEMPQKAAHDFEAFGHCFRANDTIMIPLHSPNRDPQRWQDPEEFRITRDPDVWHLSFGIGAHFCLGQAMARYTIEEALAVFVERCRSFELAQRPEWEPCVMENRLRSLALNVVMD
ncbi:MAG: cytochrome P450 [Gammaproteobacteria bacterium]|nr:cytochrome P450 [Gammaproteobacteria bacterium]